MELPRRALLLFALLLVILCVVVISSFMRHGFSGLSLTASSTPNIPAAGEVSIEGKMVCLPHRDQSDPASSSQGGPQTDECAFGLLDGTGRYFALADSDPSYADLMDAPVNALVEVRGVFTPRADPKYQDIGIITVAGITPAFATSTQVSGEGIARYDSGVRGVVQLSPTCPVERMPPDPNCAPKPYQTTVTMYRADDTAHAFVVTQSDAQGLFEATLPPGDYTIQAGESMLPRCPQESVTVVPGAFVSTTISCDTGIR